jgi:uncharacterized membrane protein
MSLELAPFLVLMACAFAWVGLDLLRKLLVVHAPVLPMTFALVAAQLPLFFLWAAAEGRFAVGAGYWLPGSVCIAVNLVANLAYMKSVRLSPMSATLPLLSLTPVFTTLAAIPLLGEWPRPVQALGILIVVAGALSLNAGPGQVRSLGGLLGSLVKEPGAPWMVATALCWSIAPPLDKLAMRHASPGTHAFIMAAGIVLGLAAMLLSRGRLSEVRGLSRRAVRVLAASAVVCGVALFFQLLAIRIMWVGMVETVKRGIGAMMALILGRLVFGEELEARRFAAVLMMIVGVWLVLM